METKGTLLSYRPDIRVVDATIRDGGLVNDFRFTDEFVKKLYETNIKAGVDYMEFGYKASKEIFDTNEFGIWKFCDEEDIRRIVGDNDTDMKIAVMADVGRTDYKKDIIDRADSVIDLIRIATYINTIPAAIEMAEYCHEKGYETTINIMAVSNDNDADIDEALELICQSNVDGVYIVDSYGAIYPEQMRKLSEKYCRFAEKAGKFVGIHAHNNQQLAFANTIEALRMGVSYLDVTVNGMGRGAGNCSSELLLGFLKNPKFSVIPLLDFLEKYMLPLKEQGVTWGYDIPYLLTGQLNQHPRTAIEAIKQKRTDYKKFYVDLYDYK
ncbi:aldolase catalytic domain-containing protein [Eubacterium xylanophilum]|uniref:aldolase catalytic domain-containing protein n=1 Tax=Eubacterium xylanophilum TaxID=39497 RepID=UPI00047ADC6E|nr:aldolase catalytic domain-containing protein [Eubacterium xylanophilum]